MGEPQISPIPQCEANWDRLSPGAQKIIQGWIDEGQYEQIEKYVGFAINPSFGNPQVGTGKKRGGGRSFGSPEDLDYSPHTYEISTKIVSDKIATMRGECYYGLIAWVRDRSDPFFFSDLMAAGNSPETSVRGCLRRMRSAGVVDKNPCKSGARATYFKVAGSEPLIDQLLRNTTRYDTQRSMLTYIAKSNGEYFTLGDAKEDVPGKAATISSTISTLVRRGILEAVQGKNGCKIYRLMPD
jgi:hypothetical protein